jgi:hypothetical protein
MKRFFAVFLFIFLISAKTVYAQVVINEFVPDSSTEWVEFHNASDSAEYLKSYYLDNDTDFNSDSGSSAKKALTNLNITNVQYPYLEFSSFLNNSGDYVVLFDQNGTIIDQYQYTSDPGAELSIGRSPDITGSFTSLSSTTKGLINSGPQPTPTPSPTLSPSPSPTATPTSTPIPTKTPTSTSKPTVTVAATSTLSPIPTATSTTSAEIVPAATGEVLSDKIINEDQPKKFPVIPAIILALGIFAVLVSIFLFVSKKLKDYNDFNVPKKDS